LNAWKLAPKKRRDGRLPSYDDEATERDGRPVRRFDDEEDDELDDEEDEEEKYPRRHVAPYASPVRSTARTGTHTELRKG